MSPQLGHDYWTMVPKVTRKVPPGSTDVPPRPNRPWQGKLDEKIFMGATTYLLQEYVEDPAVPGTRMLSSDYHPVHLHQLRDTEEEAAEDYIEALKNYANTLIFEVGEVVKESINFYEWRKARQDASQKRNSGGDGGSPTGKVD